MTPPSESSVSFVVPAFNAAGTIGLTIASIREAAPGAEIIVVDDASSDGTKTAASLSADVVFARPSRGGAAKARNDGAEAATANVLVFVDADVTINAHAVSGALRCLEEGADAVFGAYSSLPPLGYRNVVTTFKNLLHHFTHLRAAGTVRTFWAGFGAVKRAAFWAVGGFDPDATRSADVEDIELGYRLTRAGYRIVLDPGLLVLHHKRYSLPGLIRSDVMHRALPWAKAMLRHRVRDTGLNVQPRAMIGAVLAWTFVVSVVLVVWTPVAVLAAGAALVGWAVAGRDFLAYTRRTLGGAAALPTYFLFGLYHLYSPLGLVLGTLSFVLDRGSVGRPGRHHVRRG